MAMNLNKRELIAMEIVGDLIKSPWFYDQEAKNCIQGGGMAKIIVPEAIEMTDELLRQLSQQAEGSLIIVNSDGENVPVTPTMLAEITRLVGDNRESDAEEALVKQTNCSKKTAKAFISENCKGTSK